MNNKDEIRLLRKKFLEEYEDADFYSAIESMEKLVKLHSKDCDEYEQSIDLYNLGFLYQKTDKTPMCIRIYKKILKILDNKEYDISNTKDLKKLSLIIDTENALGICYSKMGNLKYNFAIKSFEKALNLTKNFFSNDKLKLPNILHNLGCVYYDLEKYQDAIYYHLEELSLRNNSDLDYIDNLNYLGYDYEAIENYDKAVEFFNDALQKIKALQGIKSDEYMNNTYYLASVYLKMKDYENSIKFHEKACLCISEKLGENHPYFADALSGLAQSYTKIGKTKDAINIQLKATKIVQDTVGENHIFYANNIKKLADLYYLEKDYEKSLIYYEKEIGIKKTIIGSENEEYVNSLLNIINLKTKLGNYDECEPLKQKILNLINFNFSETSYKRALLILLKIFIVNDISKDFYNIYDAFKNVDSSISFDEMLKNAKEIQENITNKENDILEEEDTNNTDLEEENIFDGIKNFLDNIKEQVEKYNEYENDDDEKNS